MAVTADSQPIYSTEFGVIQALTSEVNTDGATGNPSWVCDDWRLWFEAQSSQYGKDVATQNFITAWLNGLSKSAGGNGLVEDGSGYIYDSVPLSCRSLDSNFQSFLNDNPQIKSAVFSGVAGSIAGLIGTGHTVVVDAGNVVSNVADSVSNTSNTFKYLVPIVVIILVIGLLIYLGKRYGVLKIG